MDGGRSGPVELVLHGRREECAVLDGLLERAAAGHSGVLLVRGEAGVGKTALLEYAVASASDFRVVRTAGVQSEMELAFAALHQLCAPLLDWLERLPGPQRDALRTTFALRDGAVPDRFLVGLATLSLISEVGEERPVLCVIDDAQSLDRASAQALAFVARRLLAEPAVLLFAARGPTEELAGLPELVIEGLRDADARKLLASVIPGRLDERVADQLVAETRGNPLALLELPRGLSGTQLAGGFGLPAAVSLESGIEERFLQRLQGLPVQTRQLLLLAAAEPLGDPALLWRAAERLGIPAQELKPAERAELLHVDGRVRFRHPLVRSAVYRAAPRSERRRVHLALAEATDPEVDPDRRAWHLAEATATPDEDVAADLEGAAARAQARGGLAAAAAFLERAAMLTPAPSRRARRALAAARTTYEAGRFDDARDLLATADAGALDQPGRAGVHLLRAQMAFASRRGSDAPPLLMRAARELETVDPDLARATYLEALSAAMFAGRLARGGGVVEVSEAALAGPAPPQPPRPPDLLLLGLATRFTKGYAAGAPILKKALGALRRETALPPQEARWLWFAGWVALNLWDDETWTVLSTRQLGLVREAGALTALPFVLTICTSVYAFFGELTTAASLAEETRAVTEATRIAAAPYGELSLAALRGREAELSDLIDTSVGEAQARGEGLALGVSEFLSAVLHNGLGRYDAALAAVGHCSEEGPATWALPELIEAAARCEEHDLGARARAAHGDDPGQRHRSGPGDRSPLARSAQ
jgi:tetratricopeptide (TPR) repeat protein